MDPDDNKIKSEILKAIASGEIKQRTRRYFILRGALIGVGIGLVFCLVLYLASFILFVLRQTGVWFVPAFGLRGWFAFLRSAPWLLVGLAVIFIVLLEMLVRRYAFAYREPLAYSVLAILMVTLAGGFLVYETSVHRVLFQSARQASLPSPFGDFYRGYAEERFKDIHIGQVLATTSNGFVIQEPFDDATDTVVVASDTQLPSESGIGPNDVLVVFGSEASNVIQAVGIHRTGSDVLWVAPLAPSGQARP